MKTCLLALASVSLVHATPIPLVNPSAEIGSNIDGTPVSDPAILGWDGTGLISDGDTDYGNGRWKLLFEDSESVRQLSAHQIEAGAAYSIRFDAALSSSPSSQPADVLAGGPLLNGDFNADSSAEDSRLFADTPEWTNLGAGQGVQATRTTGALPSADGTRNAVLADSGSRVFGLDTNHDLSTGELLQVSYQWRDASGWNDALDQVRVTLFTTDDDTLTGNRTDIESLLSGPSTINSTYEFFQDQFAPIPASADGKRLFVALEAVDGDGSPNSFARLDNFVLKFFSPILIGPYTRNGDFNDDTSAGDQRTFGNTPFWENLAGADTATATRLTLNRNTGAEARNAQLSHATTSLFGQSTGYTMAEGDVFSVSYWWRDAFNWNDAVDKVRINLFTTATDTLGGARTTIASTDSALSTIDSTYEQVDANDFYAAGAADAGKTLFVDIDTVNADGSGFARLDDFLLSVNDSDPAIPSPPPPAPTAIIIAEAYVDNAGTPEVIASRSFTLLSQGDNQWHHYHFAIPAGTLDAFAGQEIGIRFRGPDTVDGLFTSVDNVRLEYWPAAAPDGSFADNWDSTPDQVWVGPGYWANRLHDWQVGGGRVNCINGSRERRTLHRPGTSIRGNGGDFSLSVRTGLHAGSDTGNSRGGFLIGAGPNLDWRGALLVQDSLGRDFGLFLGVRTDGAAVIEDYSTGAVTTLAAGTAAGFTNNSRLDLSAAYRPGSGEYSLTIEVRDPSDVLLSTATATVPSDRVLGSFGLLSHRGSGSARFWFDDFSGTGTALQPEPDRHLAIIGAMHTLSRGTLKLTAQLPPLDLASTPTVALDTWDGGGWQQAATAPLDTTDSLSSYTATFKIHGWDDTGDTDYRVRVNVGGTDYDWTGTVRRDPSDRDDLVIASTTCQRIADQGLEAAGVDWSPGDIWHPHPLAFTHIAKHQPDVLLALGDQIYEGQPTPPDNSNAFNRHHDYLYKWYLWMLQVRDLARDIPTIAIPDDHDIYQGNLWGEGGIATTNQNTGGYVRPATWVKMVERTQTSNLPDADPYNPIQPAPPVAQGIEVYFTGMTYGRVGFAILEDRKFKTGSSNPPSNPDDQVLLGERQHDFLRAWNDDWDGQDMKLVTSQSPFGNLHTHGSSGYNFNVNDKDTHGWPLHRRNEAWELLRTSRMFQLAGDQHLATVVHHGILAPRDAGYSFTAPAIANFFPRVWDPVHNTGGKTAILSPYLGDFFFDGNGTLPSGEPNLTATDPSHLGIVAAANPLEYYLQSAGINPANLHDRGAGYGIVRIDKSTRRITFECWPLHADPEFPQTGSQFAGWPVTINQADNDGRTPTGFLPLVDTLAEKAPVISVYDETSGDLVYVMRFPGNLVRLPVYDNGTTYRVELAYGDEPVSEVRPNQAAAPEGPAAIRSFLALRPSIITGESTTLQWDVASVATLTIDNGFGDVSSHTVNGIGQLPVAPTSDTTYTLTLNGSVLAQATVLVFPTRGEWNDTHFSPAERADPAVSGDLADPDGDGFTNGHEFQFQTDPRSAASVPALTSDIVVASETATVEFSSPFPLQTDQCTLRVEVSDDMQNWLTLTANSYQEIARISNPAGGTTRITVRFSEAIAGHARQFYRAAWEFPQ